MLGDVKCQGSNPMKYNSKRILVGIEDSDSSTHALEYVADLARGDGGFVIHAFHAIGPFLWSCVSSVGLRIQELKDNWIHSCNKNVIIGSERPKPRLVHFSRMPSGN